MPRGDGTGPVGAGPRSGRAAGFCAGYGAPGFPNTSPRYGRGRGGAWGRAGWGRGATGPAGQGRGAVGWGARAGFGLTLRRRWGDPASFGRGPAGGVRVLGDDSQEDPEEQDSQEDPKDKQKE